MSNISVDSDWAFSDDFISSGVGRTQKGDGVLKHSDDNGDRTEGTLGFNDESSRECAPVHAYTSAVDSLEIGRTAARNGRTITTLAQLVEQIALFGVEGPRRFSFWNIHDRAGYIGEGAQFTVFRDTCPLTGTAVVYKRVKISQANLRQQDNSELNREYLRRLRAVELEVLSLCHPHLKRHRNIVNLLAWGYDFDDRKTPMVTLVMESAQSSLLAFLQNTDWQQKCRDWEPWEVQHQLTLDVAAGMQALHDLKIVHGDLKPDNVLVFKNDNPNLPYVAKLSDFGVCIDMQDVTSGLHPDDYTGTWLWKPPELLHKPYDEYKYGKFDPSTFLAFDAYSFGLCVLAIFCTKGSSPYASSTWKSDASGAENGNIILSSCTALPETICTLLVAAIAKLFASKPNARALPTPTLLRADCASYSRWVEYNLAAAVTQSCTIMDTAQKWDLAGNLYWSSVDDDTFSILDRQFKNSPQNSKDSTDSFPNDVLLGLALGTRSSLHTDYIQKTLRYMLAASKAGNVVARAIYTRIYNAPMAILDISTIPIKTWAEEAARHGFLFPPMEIITAEDLDKQQNIFRSRGGYCDDPCFSRPEIIGFVKTGAALKQFLQANDPYMALDSVGNTLLHLTAALGHLEAIEACLASSPSSIERTNERGETALYKACQAGQTRSVKLLLEHGSRACPEHKHGISPLHWLFNFPKADVPQICEALVSSGANPNQQTHIPAHSATAEGTRTRKPRPIPSRQYPFFWPPGTPLHWAQFTRNIAAIDALLANGAQIDIGTGIETDTLDTPLARAVRRNDTAIVRHLLEHGADPQARDEQNRTLLHYLTSESASSGLYTQRHFEMWVTHGNWEARFHAARETVALLLDVGVDVECRSKSYGKHTALLEAVGPRARDEAVVLALLEHGADVRAAHDRSGDTVLHFWAKQDARSLAYPDAYTLVMQAITTRLDSLNIRGGWDGDTGLHSVARSRTSDAQVDENIRLLLNRETAPADINACNTEGVTPILLAAHDQIGIFLRYGAAVDVIDDYGDNIIKSIVSSPKLLDHETYDLLRDILFGDQFTETSRADFIRATHTLTLCIASYSCRLKTVQLLLDLGMDSRRTDIVGTRSATGTALDHAYYSGDHRRVDYMRQTRRYKRAADLREAEESGALYDPSFPSTPNSSPCYPLREKEAYWAAPAVIALLERRGFERTFPTDSESEPTYMDAVVLPAMGYTPDTQPHRAHWEIIYRLQRPLETCEAEAWATICRAYEAEADDWLPRTPCVAVFKRWPQLVEVRNEVAEGGWYEALGPDDSPTLVQIQAGKVVDERRPGSCERV